MAKVITVDFLQHSLEHNNELEESFFVVDRKVKSEGGMGEISNRRQVWVQITKRTVGKPNPILDSCDSELLERDIHIERLLDRHALVADTNDYTPRESSD